MAVLKSGNIGLPHKYSLDVIYDTEGVVSLYATLQAMTLLQ